MRSTPQWHHLAAKDRAAVASAAAAPPIHQVTQKKAAVAFSYSRSIPIKCDF